MARYKNVEWNLPGPKIGTWEQVHVAVLMDIRDELRAVRVLLSCFRIPRALDAIDRIDRLGVKRRVSRKRKAAK